MNQIPFEIAPNVFKFKIPSFGNVGTSPIVPTSPIVGLILLTPQKEAGNLKLPLKSPPILTLNSKLR
jgi:hypothetical protein